MRPDHSTDGGTPAPSEWAPASARTPRAISTYFEAIDASDPDRALACFDADGVFAAPPAGDEHGVRVVRAGREALHRMLEDRGEVTWRHRLTMVVTGDSGAFVEGELVDAASGSILSNFTVVATLTSDGLISEFRSHRRAGPAGSTGPHSVRPWLSLLDAASRPDATDWARRPVAPDALICVPHRPLPCSIATGLQVDWAARSEDQALLAGRLGEAVEFVVAAREDGARRLVALRAHWCYLHVDSPGSRKIG